MADPHSYALQNSDTSAQDADRPKADGIMTGQTILDLGSTGDSAMSPGMETQKVSTGGQQQLNFASDRALALATWKPRRDHGLHC
jgi:hypothetical protein